MTTRAVLYARVSSDDTRNESRNLRGQIDMCRDYAMQRDWLVVAELSEDDRGASGASLELPQLNRLLDMARAGECDVVVVREIDRFSRTLAKQLIVEEELRRHGVNIEYVLGEYPNTPEGNLMKHVKASIAEYEREKIIQRMTRGRQLIVKGGSVMLHGRPAPFGYRASADGRMLQIYEPEARIVRLIFSWYAEGDETGKKLGLRKIAHALTAMKVPTWTDVNAINTAKKRRVGEWCPTVVWKVLCTETYAGLWHYGRRNGNEPKTNDLPAEWLAVPVPAIVSRELWAKVQEQRTWNSQQASRNRKYFYLLAGKRLTCGHCGGAAYAQSVRKPDKVHQYYRCATALGYIVGKECEASGFPTGEVDSEVWSWVKSLLSDPQVLIDGIATHQVNAEKVQGPLRERMAVVEKLIDDNRSQLQRLLDLYLAGEFPRDVLAERKQSLEKTLAALEQEHNNLQARLTEQEVSVEQILQLQEFAARASQGLEQADTDLSMRQTIVERLDVRGTLVIEDGEFVVYPQCMLNVEPSRIVLPTTRRCRTRTPAPTGSGRQCRSL